MCTLQYLLVGAGFQAPAGVAFAPAAPAMAAGGAATEAEDDGMPKEDPSKLERAPGEEDEEVRRAVVSKLLILVPISSPRVG